MMVDSLLVLCRRVVAVEFLLTSSVRNRGMLGPKMQSSPPAHHHDSLEDNRDAQSLFLQPADRSQHTRDALVVVSYSKGSS
jgi:hypothetical protein